MGWFSKKPKITVVRIAYRDSHGEPAPDWNPTDMERGYAFNWALKEQPALGMRVIVPGGDGLTPAVVVGFGTTYKGELGMVRRVATGDEIARDQARYAREHEKATADAAAWLQMACKAAGLTVSGRTRTKVPTGFPAIAPVDGSATQRQASEYGRMWWRAYKQAEEAGLPADQVQHLKSIARQWFAVRDKGES
ncbi:hypothetical protein [Microbacterium sp. KR10-403]|uniref:hypothetical protein n=1 Tax=Microbacterium sp. KR10-403 TaxID=3158581 RepID=UPI0032E49241